jgi:hypothetical protein
MSERARTFLVRLRAEHEVDPIRALRLLLKTALRKFGLRCIDCVELHEERAATDIKGRRL